MVCCCGRYSDHFGGMGDSTMSFNLRSVCIYSNAGKLRIVSFPESGLSIITGSAKTGKSSIIDIIDYCFGRSECYVAEGVIRRHVSWFGVEIANQDDVMFVGRRNPGVGRSTSPDIYIRRGRNDRPPDYSELRKNTTEEALIRLLTRFAGMAENENRPVFETRHPLQATIRHAVFLCFQKQDEIASRDRLFHRQGEQFIPQAIRDTVPYFLGAVDEEQFIRQYELDDAKLQLRKLQVRKEALGQIAGNALQKMRRFIADARRVGLVDDRFESSDVERLLGELTRVVSADIRAPTIVDRGSDVVAERENELETLRRELSEVQKDIRATRLFVQEQTNFSREASEQKARLESIGLFTATLESDDTCPVCESTLENRAPVAEDLMASLKRLEAQLDAVGIEDPHLQQRLDRFGKRRIEIEEAIVAAQGDLERTYVDNERARIQRDRAIDRARVVGRIGAFLEEAVLSDDNHELDRRIEEAQQKVDALAERVSADEVEQRVFTFLNLIADDMTDYAARLSLEHAERRIRLDLRGLSVVADTTDGPIPLNRIGSGENWIGYHVVTLLALHRWFRERNRPVPGVLILDQPSQAHYPPEADEDGKVAALQDADRRAVHDLFELMHDVSAEVKGFQLIVLDHAHLDDEWFGKSIVEEWRDGEALVPANWIGAA